MNKDRIFETLANEDKTTLLTLLQTAYDCVTPDERAKLFGQFSAQEGPRAQVDGQTVLDAIERFAIRSRQGEYYASFNINSKNYMYLPKETKAWFRELGEFLQNSVQLVAQEEYQQATACFGRLYELIAEMEVGERIVFGDEIGSWLIPGEEKRYLSAYITALAQCTSPEQFASTVAPLARRDSYQSLSGEVYVTACRVASLAQKEKLDAEIRRLNIRTERR